MPAHGRHNSTEPRPHKERAKEAAFNNSAIGAQAAGRTYYQSPCPCTECGTTFYWAHNKSCMHCNPNAGDRLGMDTL